MVRFTDGLYYFSYTVLKWLFAAFALLLLISGLFHTCYALDMDSQKVLHKSDNLLLTLGGLLCFGLLAWGAMALTKRFPRRFPTILMGICFGWYVLAGILLILFSKTIPAADAWSVYSIADELSKGNLGVIHPTDSYLSYYPQQVGLVAYYEVILRIWNALFPSVHGYHFLKCLNLLWVLVILYFQHLTVELLFPGHKAKMLYLLLSLVNFPLLLYTSFVYGEIPSLALFSVGLWSFLKLVCAKKEQTGKSCLLQLCLSFVLFGGAVALRKNTLILMIAVILVTLLEWLKQRRPVLFVALLCYLSAAFLTLPLLTGFYEFRAGNTLSKGVTPLSYFAMGMQEASRGEGWYNGFNFNTFRDTGMDPELTDELSRQAIRERMNHFAQNPGYAFSFYKNKYFTQWTDGSYASRQATLATFGGRTPFFEEFYQGDYSPFFIEWCNLLQTIVYLGVFLFALFQLKEKGNLCLYLCLIGVFGGFLFHMIWEANSRYIFTYGMLLIPYAAGGLSGWKLISSAPGCSAPDCRKGA